MIQAAASWYWWKQKSCVLPAYVRGPLTIATEPVVCLAESAKDAELGRALREALDLSARMRREPDGAAAARVLKALGSKSWRTLEREARCLSIAVKKDQLEQLEITPLAYWEDKEEDERGLRGGKIVNVSRLLSDDAIGRTLRELTTR